MRHFIPDGALRRVLAGRAGAPEREEDDAPAAGCRRGVPRVVPALPGLGKKVLPCARKVFRISSFLASVTVFIRRF